MQINNITQCNNELWINGEKVEQPKSLFFKNCIVTNNNRIYINGKEKINGVWKYTLRSIFATLF